MCADKFWLDFIKNSKHYLCTKSVPWMWSCSQYSLVDQDNASNERWREFQPVVAGILLYIIWSQYLKRTSTVEQLHTLSALAWSMFKSIGYLESMNSSGLSNLVYISPISPIYRKGLYPFILSHYLGNALIRNAVLFVSQNFELPFLEMLLFLLQASISTFTLSLCMNYTATYIICTV